MPRYVAFLRALNVRRHRTVKMAALCQAFEEMGFNDVTSYIASGNILFSSTTRNAATLEDRIEEGLMERLGYEVTPFVRTIPELARLADVKPFPESTIGANDQLAVILLSTPLAPEAARALEGLRCSTDEFRVEGREVFWLRHIGPDGQVHFTAPFDQVILQPFTIRSANTVAKIVERSHGEKHGA